MTTISDPEAKRLAEEFVGLFQKSGWNVVGGLETGFFSVDPVGVEIHVNEADITSVSTTADPNAVKGRIFPAANALVNVLRDFRFITPNGLKKSHAVEVGTAHLMVGSKPAP